MDDIRKQLNILNIKYQNYYDVYKNIKEKQERLDRQDLELREKKNRQQKIDEEKTGLIEIKKKIKDEKNDLEKKLLGSYTELPEDEILALSELKTRSRENKMILKDLIFDNELDKKNKDEEFFNYVVKNIEKLEKDIRFLRNNSKNINVWYISEWVPGNFFTVLNEEYFKRRLYEIMIKRDLDFKTLTEDINSKLIFWENYKHSNWVYVKDFEDKYKINLFSLINNS